MARPRRRRFNQWMIVWIDFRSRDHFMVDSREDVKKCAVHRCQCGTPYVHCVTFCHLARALIEIDLDSIHSLNMQSIYTGGYLKSG